jgi:hypothetical protein
MEYSIQAAFCSSIFLHKTPSTCKDGIRLFSKEGSRQFTILPEYKRFFPWKRTASFNKRDLGETLANDDFGAFGYDKREMNEKESV